MENNNRGILLILIKAEEDRSYGYQPIDTIKASRSSVAFYDVDNYSDSLVLHMAEKFIFTLEESMLVIVDKAKALEINGITRLLANLSKANKKPSKTIYLGENASILRFSHFLSIQQIEEEKELQTELKNWLNAH